MGGGIDRWDEATSSFEHFSLSKLANGAAEYDFIYALHETADGRVWVGTRVGLVVLDPVRNTASRVDLATVPEGEHPLVTAIYADRKGRLWIATIEHGVLILDPATGRSMRPHAGAIGEPGSLPDTRVSEYREDRQHHLRGILGQRRLFRAARGAAVLATHACGATAAGCKPGM